MTYVFENANLFTATERDPIRPETTLAVADGRIVGVGDRAREALRSDDREYDRRDLAGKWVVPGFIDCHVHLCLDGRLDPASHQELSVPEQTVLAVENARRQVQAGFTTVRDCGSRASIDVGVRDGLEATSLRGPRILAAGRPLGITGGHGSFIGCRAVDGPDEFRAAARETLDAGADLLKIIATGGVLTAGSSPAAQAMADDEIEAVVAEARRAGCPVAAHAHGAGGIRAAAEAGVDTVEHCTYATAGALDAMAAADVAYVSTIVSTVVQTTDAARDAGLDASVVDQATDALVHQLETFHAAQDRDIRIVLGTDAGTPRNPHGSGAREFSQFVDNGVDEVDALRAGTRDAAAALGIDDDVGTLAPGKAADLVVLPGDPREDISVTERPDAVYKAGTPVGQGGTTA
jgi:imidazolonepropionase-like amidohydrolase